jgi:hypothetical protein
MQQIKAIFIYLYFTFVRFSSLFIQVYLIIRGGGVGSFWHIEFTRVKFSHHNVPGPLSNKFASTFARK